ncbi:Sperm associated antigen 1 [Chytriomyces hyalinus]|nr:Sperm associated antigen 1 [Chytriomyces hyalinus]
MDLSQSDVKQLASTFAAGGEQDAHANSDDTITDYDVECLDYSFLQTASAKDMDRLVSLLRVLRSGKEGIYPDLERAFEDKIVHLDASMAARIKDPKTPPKPTFSCSDVDAAKLDLANWTQSIKQKDSILRSQTEESGKSLRKMDSAICVRGSTDKDLHSDENSASSSDNDDDSSDQRSLVNSKKPVPKSILKIRSRTSSPSSDNADEETDEAHQKKAVRFQDEVEAQAREMEGIKRKQEKRARQIEMHLAHPVGEKKKAGSKQAKSRSPSPSHTAQQQQQQHQKTSADRILIKEVDSSKLPEPKKILIQEVNSEMDIQTTEAPQEKHRIKSFDYGAWDKFDVDKELEKLETTEADISAKKETVNSTRISEPSVVKNAKIPDVRPSRELENDVIATQLAEREKEKGNECFKVQEYVDALTYYTRSLDIKPQATVYNNRSLVHLKTKEYSKAERDATAALEFEDTSTHYKSYLRRALALCKRGKYVDSLRDLDMALTVPAPQNGTFEATKLRAEVLQQFEDAYGSEEVKKLLGGEQVLAERGRSLTKDDEYDEQDDDRSMSEDEQVEGEIVTPLGTSCGNVQRERAAAPVSRNDKTRGRTKPLDKGKQKTDGYPVFEEADEMEKGCQAAADAVREILMKQPGFASGSGLAQEKKCDIATAVVGNVETVRKIVVEEVDEDSDADESDAVVPLQSSKPARSTDSPCPATPMDSPNQMTAVSVPTVAKNASYTKPRIFSPAKTSLEFETDWKALKNDKLEWESYIRRTPVSYFFRLLSGVMNPNVLPDVFGAFAGIVEDDAEFVCNCLDEIQKIPRLKVLIKMSSRKEKADQRLAQLVKHQTSELRKRIARVVEQEMQQFSSALEASLLVQEEEQAVSTQCQNSLASPPPSPVKQTANELVEATPDPKMANADACKMDSENEPKDSSTVESVETKSAKADAIPTKAEKDLPTADADSKQVKKEKNAAPERNANGKGQCWCCWESDETDSNPLIRVCHGCKDVDLQWVHQKCVNSFVSMLPKPRLDQNGVISNWRCSRCNDLYNVIEVPMTAWGIIYADMILFGAVMFFILFFAILVGAMVHLRWNELCLVFATLVKSWYELALVMFCASLGGCLHWLVSDLAKEHMIRHVVGTRDVDAL